MVNSRFNLVRPSRPKHLELVSRARTPAIDQTEMSIPLQALTQWPVAIPLQRILQAIKATAVGANEGRKRMSELFIQRPITTTLIMVGIVLFGLIGYRALPVSDLPNVDFPTIQVTASLPGANPETMASSVATPLERQFSTIAGLNTVS